MDQAAEAVELISQLQNVQKGDVLPSARTLLAIGHIVYRAMSQSFNSDVSSEINFAYQNLVESLPASHWTYCFEVFQQATQQLVTKSKSKSELESKGASWEEELLHACQSIHGLLTSTPQLCQLAFSNKWMASLASVYDKFIVKDVDGSYKQVVLAIMSSLLLDGLLLKPQSGAEESLLEAIKALEEESIDCLGDVQDWQSQKEPFRRTLEGEVRKLYDGKGDHHQKDYILSMLKSSREKETKDQTKMVSKDPSSNSTQYKQKAKKAISAADELERRIQQVKNILPDFGEGFIEAALSFYQGDVEATIATLLMDTSSYPASLRVVDRSLPRRRKERSQEEAEEAARARQLVKERVAAEQDQEEAKYKALLYVSKKESQNEKLHSEYDDDYDDQYDELDVKLGGTDDGMYDFEQVKLYNQLVRTEEAEDSFWQDNANTNRASNIDKITTEADGKQYRGPSKIKGGRIIGADGKVVRKPGGQRGKKNNNNKGNSGSNGPVGQKQPPSIGKNGNSSEKPANGQQGNKSKPKTKPKSQNRVNRQRDKKAKSQGTFGAVN